jgi:nucleotide-binding universal stress UspA family protein
MTFDKILLALDGSQDGQIATDYAFWLARKLDANLTAQHVVDPRLINLFLNPEFGKELGLKSSHEIEKRVFSALRKIGCTVLEVFSSEAKKQSLNVSTALDEGCIVERILKFSARFDLVVVGHHSGADQKNAERLPLGAVAERVALGAQIPVLIAVQPITQIDQVLVAYDGSEPSRGALLMAESFAKQVGAKLRAVTVVKDATERDKAQLLVEDGEKFLRETWSDSVFSIQEGSIGATILGETQKTAHSLLVLGAYGYKDPEENVLGSTTTQVIRNTNSSVLIFRPRESRKTQSATELSCAQSS